MRTIEELIDAEEFDKAAHLFYGMSEEVYDLGLRFDFKNVQQHEHGDTTIPIVNADGSPLRIKNVRTEGRLIQTISVKA